MRIAFLSGYDLLQPKLDRRIFIEARTCQDHGHDVEVICWSRRQKKQIPEGEYEGINFYRLYQDLGSESSSFLFKAPKYFRLMKHMLKRIEEFKPDVVIAVDLSAASGTDLVELGSGAEQTSATDASFKMTVTVDDADAMSMAGSYSDTITVTYTDL